MFLLKTFQQASEERYVTCLFPKPCIRRENLKQDQFLLQVAYLQILFFDHLSGTSAKKGAFLSFYLLLNIPWTMLSWLAEQRFLHWKPMQMPILPLPVIPFQGGTEKNSLLYPVNPGFFTDKQPHDTTLRFNYLLSVTAESGDV